MKTLKKLFSVSAIVALLGTLAPMYAFGAGNSLDLDPEFPQAYAYAYANGITTQSEDNADMGGKLTRIALAKMIAKYAINVLNLTPDTSKTCNFTDVTAALDAQYDNGVTQACQLGLMGVNITAFRPNDLVTRGEFGTTFSRALNANSDNLAAMNAADPYYKEHLNYLNKEGIMKVIDPNMLEVRGYVMLMMMRSDDSYEPSTAEGCSAEELLACFNADDYDACIAACSDEEEPEEPEEPNAGDGFVTVKKGTVPATQNVALNAVEKSIGTIKLTAGDYDTTVSTITVRKEGLGDAEDIVSLRIFDKNGVRISKDGKLKNSEATIRISPAMIIKAGHTEELEIVVNLSGEVANGIHEFSVVALNVTNGKYTGTPVKLGTLVTTNYRVKNLGARLDTESQIKAGDTNKKIGEIKLTNSNSTTANVDSLFITAESGTIAGSSIKDINLSDYLDNVKAYVDNKEVGRAIVTSNYIKLYNLDLKIASSKNVKIELRADAVYAGADAIIEFKLGANDVFATESSTNERMTSDPDGLDSLTIKGLNLEVKNNRKTDETQEISASDDEVTLLDLKVNTIEPATVRGWTLEYGNIDFSDFAKGEGNSGEIYLWLNGDKFTLIATGNQNKVDGKFINGKFTYTGTSSNDDMDFDTNASVKVTASIDSDADVAFTDGRFKFTVNAVEINDDDITAVGNKNSKQGHYTSFVASSTKLSKGEGVEKTNSIELGKSAVVLAFDLTANANNQTLTGIDINYVASTGLSKIAQSVTLNIGDDSITWEADELTGNKLSTATKNDSIQLKKGEKVNATVSILLKSSIGIIGETVSFNVTTADIHVDGTVKGSTIQGTEYQITSKVPTKQWTTKDGEKYLELTIGNPSSYNMNIKKITLSITQKAGTSNDWSADSMITLLDNNGNNLTGTTAWTGSIPNEALEFDFSAKGYTLDISNTDSVTLRVKFNGNRLDMNEVEALLSSITYGFFDDNSTSPVNYLTTNW